MEIECETCKKLTEHFLKENPDRHGYAVCEACLEKFGENIHFIDPSSWLFNPMTLKRTETGIHSYIDA